MSSTAMNNNTRPNPYTSTTHSPTNGSSSRAVDDNDYDHDHDHDSPDELDLLGGGAEGNRPEDGVLLDDPLRQDLAEPLSFKRKQKQSFFSQPSRLLTALTGGGGNSADRRGPNNLLSPNPHSPDDDHNNSTRLEGLRNHNHPKDAAAPLDWYVEGPGRRVGYEDLTAIDWIFEYTKERQRLRVLQGSATGLLGYVRQFLDASQVWVILVLTGLAVGALAAGIDVTTDWLGDIKYGYCSTEDGGAFYLNKDFCCLGYDEHSKCGGWKPWSTALGINSAGGKWFIEYFFYLVYAVGFLPWVCPALGI